MSAWRTSRMFEGPRASASLDDLTETYVITVLLLTDRFADGAELRDAFFAVFPKARESDFLNSCYLALQVLSPEQMPG